MSNVGFNKLLKGVINQLKLRIERVVIKKNDTNNTLNGKFEVVGLVKTSSEE